MQAERQPDYPLLYSLRGFRYCDLLLAAPERAAWQAEARSPKLETCMRKLSCLRAAPSPSARRRRSSGPSGNHGAPRHRPRPPHLGRAALYAAILATELATSNTHDLTSVAALTPPWPASAAPARRTIFPAASSPAPGCAVSPARAPAPRARRSDLDEAWEIAERGPMRLFLADIHLHRARLFFREATYPWESPAGRSRRGAAS